MEIHGILRTIYQRALKKTVSLDSLWYHRYMNPGQCFYCDNDAAYFDVIMDDEDYLIADVCINHLKMGLSS